MKKILTLAAMMLLAVMGQSACSLYGKDKQGQRKEQREPSSSLEWPSRDGRRRSQQRGW